MAVQPDKLWTILDILHWTTAYFQEKGIEPPRLTAEILLAHSLTTDRMYLYTHHDQPLALEERDRFKLLVKQRVQGTPTQYLTGRQEFWSLDFQVAPGALIPRPETEHLVEAALKLAKHFPQPRILDIGTGSGAIAISLKKELPQAEVYAGDISEAALTIARQNAARLLPDGHSVHFGQGDLCTPFADVSFDLILSNPPYISAPDYAALAREIKDHEPREALYAGEDGLDLYRRLIPEASAHLTPTGYVLVEIGYRQKDAVVGMFEEHGFGINNVIKDYAGIDRVVIAV